MSHYPFFGNPAVYVDPAIVTFVASPALAEMGSSVPTVSLNWTTSKAPDTLKLNGTEISPFARQGSVAGPFTTDTSFKLQCADKQRSVIGKATLSFCNSVYWGFVAAAPTDSAGVVALENKSLQISRSKTVTIGAPDGKVFCYAYPKRLGNAKVIADLSSGVWQPTTTENTKFTDYSSATVSVTNASGFTEDYVVITFNAPLNGATVVHFV
jgi:hypothetical protein